MMDSSTVRRALSLSSSAVSPGLFFTSATTMTKPMRHSTPARANATSMPKMLACVGVITRALAFVAMVDAETMMAVPSEPATWRNVLFTEVPWFTSSLSSAFMPQVVMGMFTSDSENRRTVYSTVSVIRPVSVPRNAKQNVVSVSTPMPTSASTRGPCLSNRRPAMGPMAPMMMAPGSSTRPDTVAE